MLDTATKRTVARKVHLDGSPVRVYALLAEEPEMGNVYGGHVTFQHRDGGFFCVKVNPHDHWCGNFLETVPGERIVHTWGWSADRYGHGFGASRVEITLTAAGAGTDMRVAHEGVPAHLVSLVEEYWDHYLPRLATALHDGEAGLDAGPSGQYEPAGRGVPNETPACRPTPAG